MSKLAIRNSNDPNIWRMTCFLDGGNAWQPVDPQYLREVAKLFSGIRMTVTDNQPGHMWPATYLWVRVIPIDWRPGVTGTAPITITDPARQAPQVPNMVYVGVHHPLIVGHEIGHAMGLGHNVADGHVMSTRLIGPRWTPNEIADMTRTAVRYCDHWFLAQNGGQLIYPKFMPCPSGWQVLPIGPLVAFGQSHDQIIYECPWSD